MITSPPRSASGDAPDGDPGNGAGTGEGAGHGSPRNGTGHRRPSEATPYVDLTRAEWSALRDKTPLPLTADEVERLRGLGDVIDLDEVRDIYLPLSRLLNLYVQATSGLRGALNTFLGESAEQRGTPFVIGVAGSVAVGKSTVSRLLQALLARWPEHPRVELVTTDAFLYPMEELKARGLMSRKGFPESYDRRALTRFVADVKAGKEEVSAPVYSHLIYDRVPDERLVVRRPDILIVEGLNVLQPALPGKDGRTRVGLADYFDFSVYVDARPEDIERWYLNRFRKLRDTAFQDPSSYFRRWTQVSEEEAFDYARTMWRTINKVNLLENVAPTRGRATLVVRKGSDHKVQRLSLRKL
ncbi:type I pantothenate kinase [Streptomyces sp. TLI_105]|uniref:type I pantothenate kinase n=1 Tax=Streptomyces sp. TLI_105 TaxID=1881019 RepID=UPI0008992700|nr:type I pantothenate kinase [Streptomyces sp. TLI_105]SEC70296.1 pantothenate kinase [Streptomyces sp. TLI_105]